MLGVQGKRKDIKTRKSRSGDKGVGFRSYSISPAKKLEVITQGGTRGMDHPMLRINKEAGIAKAGRTSETAGHSRYIHVKQE